MTKTRSSISFEDATAESSGEPTEEVLAWQERKIRAGLKAADEGRFASTEAVRKVIQKYVRNG